MDLPLPLFDGDHGFDIIEVIAPAHPHLRHDPIPVADPDPRGHLHPHPLRLQELAPL
jgi:hypothetical protein